MLGTVTHFGEDGWGIVTAADHPDVEYPFHSTAISGGSRQIDEGQAVSFVVVPGRGGRWEATTLVPVR